MFSRTSELWYAHASTLASRSSSYEQIGIVSPEKLMLSALVS